MMEARQFGRYAEEKMSHDAAEMAALEDALAKRDAALMRVQQQQMPRRAAASGAWTPRRHRRGTTPRCGAPSTTRRRHRRRTRSTARSSSRRRSTAWPTSAGPTTPIIRVAPGSGTFLPR
jgi:hypothetical protein